MVKVFYLTVWEVKSKLINVINADYGFDLAFREGEEIGSFGVKAISRFIEWCK